MWLANFARGPLLYKGLSGAALYKKGCATEFRSVGRYLARRSQALLFFRPKGGYLNSNAQVTPIGVH